jgi:hypothetical protein
MKSNTDNKMTRKQIEQKLGELKSLKLPQLNKKSKAHHDWKLEMEKLTSLLDVEINKMNNILK